MSTTSAPRAARTTSTPSSAAQSSVAVYLQDWLDAIYKFSPELHSVPGKGLAFLDGMASAMAARQVYKVAPIEALAPVGWPLDINGAVFGGELADLQLDDVGQLAGGEGVEDDDLVEPVEELGLEGRAHQREHRLARRLGRGRRVGQERRTQVAREDQDRVAEVDRAAVAVGEPAVVEHLQEDVERLRVGLLDLVEEDDGVGAPADGLRELAALLVADVPGGRADEPGAVVNIGSSAGAGSALTTTSPCCVNLTALPIRLNRTSYSAIGSRAPLQNSHPAGAKLPPNMRISPT
mgnify:CR=1 FL=1